MWVLPCAFFEITCVRVFLQKPGTHHHKALVLTRLPISLWRIAVGLGAGPRVLVLLSPLVGWQTWLNTAEPILSPTCKPLAL